MSDAADRGIRPLVRRAWRAARLARTAEAVLLGLGAGLLAAAGAVASGGAGGAATWGPAALAALPMGIAWLVEMRPRTGAIARRVDLRLRLGGALVAAWEVEEGRAGGLGRLLGEQLRQRLTPAAVLRAAIPNSTPLLAAPLLGFAALAAALEQRPAPLDPLAGTDEVLAGVSSAMEEAVDAALDGLGDGEVSSEQADRTRELADQARGLAHRAESMGRDEELREEVAQQVGELARDLERAARDAEGLPELEAALERALMLTDAARLAYEDLEPPAEEDPDGAGGEAGGEAGGPAGSDAAAALGDEPPDAAGPPPLAPDGPIGTMSGPPGGASGQDSPILVPPPSPGAPGGVAAGAWWPARHAGVVRRYVEERRGSASDTRE